MSYGRGCGCLSPCSPESMLEILTRQGRTPESIIDAGCGRGERLAFFGAKFPKASLAGIERDHENACTARKNCPGAEIVEADIEKCTGLGAELVLCECVLSLLPDPVQGAERLAAMTGNGGILLLSDLFVPDGEKSAHLADEGMLRNIYTKSAVEELFISRGLRLINFFDRRSDMVELACRMVMEGSFCKNVSADTFGSLRRAHAGYGVWVFEK